MLIDRFLSKSNAPRQRTPPTPGERVLARLFPNQAMGYPGAWSYQDRAKQISHFVSWAYAAINVNASLVGQHTPNLALVSHTDDPSHDPRRDVHKWYGMGMGLTGAGDLAYRASRGWDGADLMPKLPGTPGAHLGNGARTGHGMYPGYSRYKAYSTVKPHEELEPLPADHLLRRLIDNPNPYDTTYTLLYELVMFLKLTGIAYLWCVPDGWGTPCELWVMPSHWVWPRTGTGAYADPANARLISWYEIRPYGSGISGGGMLKIPKEEVIQFRYPSPLSQIDGWSKLTAVSMWLDTQESMDKSAWSQMQNQGLPSCFIELSEAYDDPNDDMIARLETKFLEKLGGEYNVGRPLFGKAGMKIIPLSFSPESMMYPQMGDVYRDKILAAFGMPKSALGISESMTYGSILATLAQLCGFVINPDNSMLGQQLTKDLCPRFRKVGGDGAHLLGGKDYGYLREGNGKRRILTDAEAYRALPDLSRMEKRRRHDLNDSGELDTSIRLWWDDCTPPDPAQVNSDIAQDMACLAISPDEVRAIRGRGPWGNPLAGMPWAQGANGWQPVPLGDTDVKALEEWAELCTPLLKMGQEAGATAGPGGEEGMEGIGEGTGDEEGGEPAAAEVPGAETPESDLPDEEPTLEELAAQGGDLSPGIAEPNGKPRKGGHDRVWKEACTPGHTTTRDGCTSSSGESESPEDDQLDVNEVLQDLGMSTTRQDDRNLDGLRNTRQLRKLSTVPKDVEIFPISKIRGLDKVDDAEPIDDPSDVPPLIIADDGELIDGHHRLSGLIAGGVADRAHVIVASKSDFDAADELGGLRGRGSWSEEFWIKWMLARTNLPEDDEEDGGQGGKKVWDWQRRFGLNGTNGNGYLVKASAPTAKPPAPKKPGATAKPASKPKPAKPVNNENRGKPCKPGMSAARTGCLPKKKPGGREGGTAVGTAPVKPKQPAAKKPPKQTAADRVHIANFAVKRIGELLAGTESITPQHIGSIKDVLLKLTVSEINAIKAKLGVKATGAKAALAAKVAEMVLVKKPLTASGKPSEEKPTEQPAQTKPKLPPPKEGDVFIHPKLGEVNIQKVKPDGKVNVYDDDEDLHRDVDPTEFDAEATEKLRGSRSREGEEREAARETAKNTPKVTAASGDIHPSVKKSLDHPSVRAMGDSLSVSGADSPAVAEQVADLTRLPTKMVSKVRQLGGTVHLGNGKLSQLDNKQHLSGQIPRGWDKGTWDDCAGVYGNGAACSTAANKGGGDESVILHEYGHLVGDKLGWDDDPELVEIHGRIFDELIPYHQLGGRGGKAGREEMLADAFATYQVTRGKTGWSYGPQLRQWFDKKMKEFE